MLCEPSAPVERKYVPLTRMSSLSRFSGPHTPQNVGEFHRALPRDWSRMSVPLMMSVNVEPEFSNVKWRFE